MRALVLTGAWLLAAGVSGCSSGDGAEPLLPSEGLSPGACKAGQASAQFRSQELPPLEMIPGSRAMASVTFDNCSGSAWTKTAFALRPNSPADDATWGVGRVSLPGDVPNGARVTIRFEVVAPTAPGVYPFTWKIEGDAVGSLQERSPVEEITVRHSADCTQPGPPARFQKWVVPTFVPVTGALKGSITFANCSTETWTKGDFALGSQADPDNETWGTKRIPLPHDVASQTQVTIPYDLTAPGTPGVYRFAWRLVHEGVGSSDESSPIAQVTALEPYDCSDSGPVSRFVREEGAPSVISPGEAFKPRVTFANCGREVWNGSHHVGAAAPSNDGIWGAGRVALPSSVAPGYAVTVPIGARAPGTPGTYPYRWTVKQDGVGPIDQPSPAHDVSVRCVPNCGDHSCGGDGCGGSCGSCGDGFACDGAYCREVPDTLSCSNVQWWNRPLTYGPYMSYGWWDTDLSVGSGTRVQLRHNSRLDRTGVYAWGYMPEFTDLVTGYRFRLLHLKPAYQWATSVGKVYPGGYVVGLSGGDTADTGLGPYSTGAHLCVQTLQQYRTVFPAGWDACR